MMRCYLDTNSLVYFKDLGSLHCGEARELFSSLAEKNVDLCVSPLTLDEFLYHFKKYLPKLKSSKSNYNRLSKILSEVLDLPNLEIVNPPSSKTAQKKVVKLMRKYNLCSRDAYHLLTMQYHKIRYFLTFDKDFKKVFSSKLVLPVEEI